MNINLTEELCIQALKLSHPKFNITQIDKNYYSLLEYRLLLIYSFCMTRQKKHQLAFNTTQFTLKQLDYHYKSNQSAIKLILLGLFYQSYQLFIIDSNWNTILKANYYICSFIWSLFKDSYRLVHSNRWLGPGVLQYSTFITNMIYISITTIWLSFCDRN